VIDAAQVSFELIAWPLTMHSDWVPAAASSRTTNCAVTSSWIRSRRPSLSLGNTIGDPIEQLGWTR